MNHGGVGLLCPHSFDSLAYFTGLAFAVAFFCFLEYSRNCRQVPATPDEALRTSLMGIFEKRRFRNFLQYLAGYDEQQPDTFKGRCPMGVLSRRSSI